MSVYISWAPWASHMNNSCGAKSVSLQNIPIQRWSRTLPNRTEATRGSRCLLPTRNNGWLKMHSALYGSTDEWHVCLNLIQQYSYKKIKINLFIMKEQWEWKVSLLSHTEWIANQCVVCTVYLILSAAVTCGYLVFSLGRMSLMCLCIRKLLSQRNYRCMGFPRAQTHSSAWGHLAHQLTAGVLHEPEKTAAHLHDVQNTNQLYSQPPSPIRS